VRVLSGQSRIPFDDLAAQDGPPVPSGGARASPASAKIPAVARTLAFRLLAVSLAALGIAACRGQSKDAEALPKNEPVAEATTPTSPPTTPTPLGLSAKALQAYVDARAATRAANLDEARDLLKQAVAIQPDFTEAWYNLGATTSRLSMAAAVNERDQEAIALFREAVEEKRRAQALVEDGKWFVYKTSEEQDQVISDLRHALEDADAVLADEPSLLAAMRIWAASGRIR
jgi:tetratricopeptide (TPR) repeat protein